MTTDVACARRNPHTPHSTCPPGTAPEYPWERVEQVTELTLDHTLAATRPPVTEHRVSWWVYAGRERIRHTARMRGTWGYDVTCSCGWDSRTGGGTRRYIADKLDDHRREVSR